MAGMPCLGGHEKHGWPRHNGATAIGVSPVTVPALTAGELWQDRQHGRAVSETLLSGEYEDGVTKKTDLHQEILRIWLP
jgi:hypothetical protein